MNIFKKFFLIFISLSILIVFFNSVWSDSLWQSDDTSPYVRKKSRAVGDIITVKIMESTTAVQQAQTDLSKQSDVDFKMSSAWDQVATMVGGDKNRSTRTKGENSFGGGDDYSGKGQTTRKSVVKATITVMISSDLGNGIYEVEGNHQMRVNEELEKITIKGMIRSNDIANDNTIFSTQIANAQIAVEGSGAVTAKQNPGMITRMFGWLF